MAESASVQVSPAVRAALAEAARYAALVAGTVPPGELPSRPDVSAVLEAALEEARAAAWDAVLLAWGSAPDSPLLGHLLADVARQYAALAHLRGLLRHAHAAAEPGREGAAVRDAITGFARQVSLRSHLTVQAASRFARTAARLAEGRARQDRGEQVRKRWKAHPEDPACCHWCRGLHGVTVPLGDSFLPYLDGPADLSGHGHLTRPPRPYRGELQGPQLHPHCACDLEIVTWPGHAGDQIQRPAETPGNRRSGRSTTAAFTAAQVRALPEERYRALLAFIDAALHELAAVLRRIAEAVR